VTHHLLNEQTLPMCKPGVHLLNFARGEIVDGAALNQLYQSGKMTGKYISDFADADLMGHPRHLVLPHLGASTGEAEENSAAMAADTIKAYLETGSIRHSVNFPAVSLPPARGGIEARLCIVNKNTPGVLGEITSFLGKSGINITQQLNASRGDIAYTVIDMGSLPEEPDQLQTDLASTCEGIISSRFLSDPFNTDLGKPGTYFQVSWDDANSN
jgi:D-3-phosphoglycerate dehydrogenase